MRPATLQLDFRQPPRSPWRWAGWGALALAVAGIVALGAQWTEAAERHAALERRHQALGERERAKAPRRAAAVTDPQVLADVQRANRIIEQLLVPWDALFDAVEAADARGLALLSLTPNPRDRSLRLAGEAKSVAEVLAYVNRMAEQPALGRVHLQGYNTVVRDGVTVVSFTVAAAWRQQP